MTALAAILVAVLWAALLLRVLPVAARMFQIEEYERARTLRWGLRWDWMLHPSACAAGAGALAGVLGGVVIGGDAGRRDGLSLAVLGLLVAHALWRWTPPKKPLVRTDRMRRLLVAARAAVVIAALVLLLLALLAPPPVALVAVLLWSVAVVMGSLLLLAAADVAVAPVEARVRSGFVRSARRRLAEWQPFVIGIAGSWGKTSTKHVTATLLGCYGETLPTPKSFNTLMGVTRSVNENLEARHRTFVVEMDAYGPGEIASICDLVHPRVGVLTSVGPQHLERFGSVDRIAAALYELVEALPRGGAAVVHTGEPEAAALAERARGAGLAVVGYGIDGEAPGPFDVVADEVALEATGVRFRWRWPARGLEERVAVPLLGRHQVLNVSAALAVVAWLGYPLAPAVAAAARLEPVEHRLQPVPTATGVTVIDDSYNANPVGVHNALDVLAAMDVGARILVTPGLVELGAVEAEENRRYGEHAARVCDHVVVVESRTNQPLRDGLRDGGLAAERTHVVRGLDEATAVIGAVARPGDVVLFANDLPDTYLAGR